MDLSQNKNTIETNYDTDTDTNSENDYINIEDCISSFQEKIYQIQINNDELAIKNIGYGSTPPDIIIEENFGPKNNMSLYSCVYSEEELLNYDNEKLLPIIKLHIKNDDDIQITSIVVKINNLEYNIKINDFSLHFIKHIQNQNNFISVVIDKNINSLNIVEKIIELSL
jgi:hypothetical protein